MNDAIKKKHIVIHGLDYLKRNNFWKNLQIKADCL